MRLEAALLFDEVRSLATAEERQRLAREIHDGVAQEVASLGYLDRRHQGACPAEVTPQLAALREELSRIVTELRFSIFDLRKEIGPGPASPPFWPTMPATSVRRLVSPFTSSSPSLPLAFALLWNQRFCVSPRRRSPTLDVTAEPAISGSPASSTPQTSSFGSKTTATACFRPAMTASGSRSCRSGQTGPDVGCQSPIGQAEALAWKSSSALRAKGERRPREPERTASMTIRVLLVDDHQLIREGLRRAFDRSRDFEVVGEAASVAEAEEPCRPSPRRSDL